MEVGNREYDLSYSQFSNTLKQIGYHFYQQIIREIDTRNLDQKTLKGLIEFLNVEDFTQKQLEMEVEEQENKDQDQGMVDQIQEQLDSIQVDSNKMEVEEENN